MVWEIIGHQWASRLLQGHITGDLLRHAYLITGPPGIGKRTLAIRFIQAVNCPSPVQPGVPCRSCRTCRQIQQMEHPDLLPVQSAEDSQQLRIDQVRELIHYLSLVPYQAPYRVGLLIDFEEANLESQNALLKTLEEPGSRVILILITPTPELLLETIVSRCEEIKLRPIPLETVENGLQRLHGIPAADAHLLAHISGGRPAYALALYQNPEAREKRLQLLDAHRNLLSSSFVSRFAYADDLQKDQEKIEQAIEIWSSFWHDVLLKTGGSAAPLQNIDREDAIVEISAEVSLADAHQVLASLKRTRTLLHLNANTRLTLENLLLQLPRIGRAE